MPDTLAELEQQAETVSAFTDAAQIDVMDGVFVPPMSWPYTEGGWHELEALSQPNRGLPHANTLHYVAHLMVDEPEELGVLLVRSGVRRVIGHIETMGHTNDARRILQMWRSIGAETGISLLLDTPLSDIVDVIPEVNVVQVMSIAEIGYQGHAFDERAYTRIRELRKAYPKLTISVDGGVSRENAAALVKVGANRLNVGSAIMKSDNPKKAYQDLLHSIKT